MAVAQGARGPVLARQDGIFVLQLAPQFWSLSQRQYFCLGQPRAVALPWALSLQAEAVMAEWVKGAAGLKSWTAGGLNEA